MIWHDLEETYQADMFAVRPRHLCDRRFPYGRGDARHHDGHGGRRCWYVRRAIAASDETTTVN